MVLAAPHSLWDLIPQPGIEPRPSAVKKSIVLTTALPENSLRKEQFLTTKRNEWRTTSGGNKKTKFDYIVVCIILPFHFIKKFQPAVKGPELSDLLSELRKYTKNAWVLKKEIPVHMWTDLCISVKDL